MDGPVPHKEKKRAGKECGCCSVTRLRRRWSGGKFGQMTIVRTLCETGTKISRTSLSRHFELFRREPKSDIVEVLNNLEVGWKFPPRRILTSMTQKCLARADAFRNTRHKLLDSHKFSTPLVKAAS